ncbi:MAG: GNAT family N-acetyltransferase [Amphiplicatus sp.]
MAEIRRARAEDAKTVSTLGTTTFVETFGHLYREEDLSAFLEKSHSAGTYETLLNDAAWAIWIAEQDGVPFGYSVAGPCTLPVPDMPESAGELSRLYLLKQSQGSGEGGRLLKVTLDWLEERFKHVYLSVYSENYGAQRLYARHGFEKICDYFYMVGEHADPEWIMERRR